MAIDVVGSSIVLSVVTYVQPRAKTSFIEAGASATYIEPEVKLSYLDIQVTAQVTMPDVLSVDVITPGDDANVSFLKGLAESNGVTDALTQYSINKLLTDVAYPQDFVVIGDIQPHQDAGDTLTNFPEFLGVSFVKVLADSFSFSDAVTAVRLYERVFEDFATVPDEEYLSFFPDTTIDGASATDSQDLAVEKTFTEGLTLIDNMDGDIEYTVIKSISDLVSTPVDVVAVAFMTNKDDNLATSSSGVLSMQDYSDITYFLEDYVGTSRTFT